MTNQKKTNKNCAGCKIIFSFDPIINPNRKFCNKACYLNFVKLPAVVVIKPKRLSFLQKLRIWLKSKYINLFILFFFVKVSETEWKHLFILYNYDQSYDQEYFNNISIYELVDDNDIWLEEV